MKVVNCDRTIYVRTLNIAIVCASHSFVCWFFFFFIFFFYFAIFPSLYFGGRNVSFLPRCALTDASYTDVQRNDKRKRKEAISLGLYKNRLNHKSSTIALFYQTYFFFFSPFFFAFLHFLDYVFVGFIHIYDRFVRRILCKKYAPTLREE